MKADITELEDTAWHEAGHAAVHLLLDEDFHYVTIVPGSDSEGHLRHDWSAELIQAIEVLGNQGEASSAGRDAIENKLMALFAGGISSQMKGYKAEGIWHDNHIAVEIGSYIFGQGDPWEFEAYLDWIYRRAVCLLTIPMAWNMVCQIGIALLERGTLTQDEAAEIGWKAHGDRANPFTWEQMLEVRERFKKE